MRFVFISSVTAMTPLRTISVTTGSTVRLLTRPLRTDRLGLDCLLIALVSVVPAKAGTHNHRHFSFQCHNIALRRMGPRLRGDDNNKCWRTRQGGVHASEFQAKAAATGALSGSSTA